MTALACSRRALRQGVPKHRPPGAAETRRLSLRQRFDDGRSTDVGRMGPRTRYLERSSIEWTDGTS